MRAAVKRQTLLGFKKKTVQPCVLSAKQNCIKQRHENGKSMQELFDRLMAK